MRHPPHRTACLVLGCTLLAVAAPTHAFDPNAGAEAIATAPRYAAPTTRLPTNIVPGRYYAQSPAPAYTAAPVPQPTVIAPPPIQAPLAPAPVYAAPQPATAATIAPLPEVRALPSEQFAVAATPAAGYVAPANTYPRQATPVAPPVYAQSRGYKANRFTLGVEGYYDEYQEDVVDLEEQGYFGSVSAGYEHYFSPNYFGAIELRGSRGSVDYESISGTIDNIAQWETEGRLLFGYDQSYGAGQRIKVYTGGGSRFFYDEFKGEVTSLGRSGYDRRILQFYIPVGITYEFQAYGLQFTPNIEYNHLIYGYVESRLQSIPGFQELNNYQHDGYGLRGELLVGRIDASGRGWQAGPFIRYWDIDDSDIDTTPAFTGLEPANTRLQLGAKFKYLF